MTLTLRLRLRLKPRLKVGAERSNGMNESILSNALVLLTTTTSKRYVILHPVLLVLS
jgi:hypothetical protein